MKMERNITETPNFRALISSQEKQLVHAFKHVPVYLKALESLILKLKLKIKKRGLSACGMIKQELIMITHRKQKLE